MADAAHVILTAPGTAPTGRTLIDEDVLRGAGVSDLDAYATVPGTRDLEPDFFL